ncbi:cell envelope-related function transcriptional attenuator common domain protein [[Clostridium] bifermentans ATCC 638]|uniref:Cell envelope-related function transcriptional attenuator common domain protein n=1 Tax=Paraclostridium bifermentans ATCC 638 = DSM 14991 TaxID=1233171 RepID=T4VR06_PARBF|nr:LCP family protein [Paraclostridium bifermentans]EQK43943.1 cell envelope-related function transcriptional attenuator common domain protein [[Clostridium] bifermentans ATCC 638] [Paraclostridium bifermentans ATCC 638 = DSM 14991]RIZ59366.1 LytR family transcriptional regulator [Paraclostridium bifermentans]UAG17766.1 LCP family protein [Paraclostridium bifermentans]
MSNLKKFVIALLLLVILLPAGAFGYLYFKLDSMYDNSADTKMLNKTNYKSEDGITNILLVGTDGRTTKEASRSDSMMILTIDNKHKSLKLTSLARDTYVSIPGHGDAKLNAAFAYGGIGLLIDTIESNFKLDIQNYAIVDFFSFMDIVDTLGGVVVDVKSSEISELNKFIPECYEFNTNPKKGEIKYVNNSGNQKLNGYQALAYGRIRKNDSALERDRRQRSLIEGMMSGVKNLSVTKYPELLNSILPYIKTNMKPTEMLAIGTTVLGIGISNVKSLEFPMEQYSTGGSYGHAGWVWRYDEDKCLPILHDFIFNDVEFKPSISE